MDPATRITTSEPATGGASFAERILSEELAATAHEDGSRLESLQALLGDLRSGSVGPDDPDLLAAAFDAALNSLQRSRQAADSIVEDGRAFHESFAAGLTELGELNLRVDRRLASLIGE